MDAPTTAEYFGIVKDIFHPADTGESMFSANCISPNTANPQYLQIPEGICEGDTIKIVITKEEKD